MPKSFTIKQLLLLAFLLAGILPAMLVSAFSFSQVRAVLKNEVMRDLQTLSASMAIDVQRMMFERVQNVHSWSQLDIMQDVHIGDVDKRLSDFLLDTQASYQQEYRALHVLDGQGQIVASSDATLLGKAMTLPAPWFQVQVAGKRLTLSVITEDVMHISQVIVDANSGQTIGRLVAVFNWRVVHKLLNDAVNQQAAAALMDGDGHVLAATTGWGKKGHALQVNHGLDGNMALPGWSVRIEKSHSLAVAPVHRLGYVFLALLLAALIFSLMLVRPIGQAIIQPLAQLTRFVRNFHTHAQQSATVRPPQAGPPELQELSKAFEKMILDLTKSQDNLTRAAKLAVVGEMAAAMSHEVRTPLGIMRSSADVLLREPQLSADGREVLGFIISETERLNKLVSSLIDAARPRLPTMQPLDITQLVRHVVALLQNQAQTKQISVLFNETATVMLLADQDQMTQVLMNLLMNALQILPQQGKVFIQLTHTAKAVVLTVEDNGPGIQTDNQAQIFEPFFTQRAGGVGLGLAVVRQIVQAHLGDIHYQTSQYGGAAFIMTFPSYPQV
ncbi:MAG TPA: sensor histidine kinase [Methylophilus sp.]